ncbi:MAG: alanine--glyoxylate aminotransferase family protein [Armatimonadota bacterium]|nr:alanine--glyoxylate aminotransferase family protein [Armatimonadota bacterium]MDW8024940.1 alanine--glyoxylate aminotransferase family protein [Armatimonadota bacterium]
MFGEKQILLIPGPTPVPPRVLRAMCRPMINHRGPEYESFFEQLLSKLKSVFVTDGDVIIFPASGTGAMEAAVANLLSPGDAVLMASVGHFGDRFADIARAFGADVKLLSFPWGKAVDVEEVEKEFKSARKPYRALLVTHNETSTGVTNPIKLLAAVARENEALIIVDAISSLGAIELPMDDWGVDVVIGGSQKGLMTPPGLSFVALNERAWAAVEQAKMPRYYWDFKLHKHYMERHQNPYTPALPLLFALDEALNMLFEDGLENVFARHERMKRIVRDGVREIGFGLGLLADEDVASNTVTGITIPEGVDGNAVVRRLREEHNVVVAGGMDHMRGKMIRIGHVGWVHENDLHIALYALREVITSLIK